MLGVIGLNVAVCATHLMIDGHDHTFETLEYAVLAFFAFELLVRLRAAKWNAATLLRRPLNAFDTVVIALSFLPALGAGLTLLRVARLARLLHLARHVSHLKVGVWLVRWNQKAVAR
ncbi:MAG: ion transporter [Mycobacterium sp.]